MNEDKIESQRLALGIDVHLSQFLGVVDTLNKTKLDRIEEERAKTMIC